MAKSKKSILKDMLKSITGVKAAETVGKGIGSLYGKLRYGRKYDRPADKIITDTVRKRMQEEGRGAIGQEEASKELAKRRKILKKEIADKMKAKKVGAGIGHMMKRSTGTKKMGHMMKRSTGKIKK